VRTAWRVSALRHRGFCSGHLTLLTYFARFAPARLLVGYRLYGNARIALAANVALPYLSASASNVALRFRAAPLTLATSHMTSVMPRPRHGTAAYVVNAARAAFQAAFWDMLEKWRVYAWRYRTTLT
jgi:hypothetical protein